jgi:hypothetical protein
MEKRKESFQVYISPYFFPLLNNNKLDWPLFFQKCSQPNEKNISLGRIWLCLLSLFPVLMRGSPNPANVPRRFGLSIQEYFLF